MAEKSETLKQLLDESQKLYDEGKYFEAIKLCKTAFVMRKDYNKYDLSALYIRLANSYYNLEDIDKYTLYYEEYLKYFPQGQASIFSRLAHAYYYIDADKSVDYHNKALNIKTSEYDASSKLFAMTKSAFYEQQDIKDEAEFEISKIKEKLYKNIQKYNHDDKKLLKEKKLNIGYLSSDCYTHTMMNYILPIWKNHDKNEFNFFIFNAAEKEDSTTEKIKNLGFEIIKCSNKNNEEIAKEIYEHKIDILIDLGGYTHLRSFCAFYKPAPVIMLYLGYLNTLGIEEFDYIITDRYTIPEDKAYLYTEKPLYLDKGYQIFNANNVPELEDNPYKNNGYITFGSFNCSSKINGTMIYMWSKLLEAVPSSRLLIYRTKLNKTIIKNFKDKFKHWGIAPDRVYFINTPFSPHFKAYSQADIALDTFPFSGMSIAIETAMMGVPTVTLVGDGMQSRGAGRINEVIGVKEFNASSGEEYIKIAAELAGNKEKLAELRKALREKVNNSDLQIDPAVFTRDLENKYKQAWNEFLNTP